MRKFLNYLNLRNSLNGFHRNQRGMMMPIHAVTGALIGLGVIGARYLITGNIDVPWPAVLCAVLFSFITHEFIDRYNYAHDHHLEDNPVEHQRIFWLLVGIGLACVVAVAVFFKGYIVFLCGFAAASPDIDVIARKLGIYQKFYIHSAMTHKWLIDNGSNVARSICLLLPVGAILFTLL